MYRPVVLATLLAAVVIAPASAQATTYTVFPAVSLAPSTTQPTSANATVTLKIQDSTVAYVVRTLVHQAGMKVFLDMNDPLFTKRVTIDVDHTRIMNALMIVLKGTGLTANQSPDGETILVRASSGTSSAERSRFASGTVLGRVTDSASGQGLGGAAVRVAGTKLSAVTSDSGNFTLRDVPSGDQVLTVRLFGYKPAERTVTVVDSQRTTVNIIMASVPTVLSGVITTASGTQRKVTVGNDITTINVDSVMQTAPIMSVTDLLETRVPGLTVTHTSGEPGAPSRLRLRGVGSISGNNDPIIVIDGIRVYSNQSDPRNDNLARPASLNYVNPGSGSTPGGSSISQRSGFAAPSPIDQLDPNSIETIEVFKGPSASALYGSDAANGVIVITTKHGRAGPTTWSLNVGQGVNWIPGSWPTNYFRFGRNVDGQGPICNWYDLTCVVVDSVQSFQALNDPQYTILSHGSGQTASLTVSGGSPTLQYSLIGNGTGTYGNLKLPVFQQQQYDAAYGPIPAWMIHPDQYTSWGVNGTVTVHPNSALQIALQSSLFTGAQQTSSLSGAIPELQGVYISDGIITNYEGGLNSLTTTPLVNNYVERVTDNSVTTANGLTLGWTPRSWLPITITGGLQTIERTDYTYIPYGVSASGTPFFCTYGFGACAGDTTGSYGLGRGLTHNQTLNTGTAIPLLNNRITLGVGGNFFSETSNDFQAYTDQLAPGVSSPTSFLLSSCPECEATQNSDGSSTYGWYVEPRFNLGSRFFAAPGFRFDGGSGGTHTTSTGGAVGGLSAFPKLDLSYVAVDRQGGHPLFGVLTLFRPRVAFGLAGTQPLPQDRLRLYNENSNVEATLNPGGEGSLLVNPGDCGNTVQINGVSLPAVCLSTLGNTQLRPERSSELEGGFDATLWNGRITLTLTQYNKTRKDAIIDIPIAPSASGLGGGSFTVAENVGEVRNTGTELTINTTVLESRSLSWNVGANLSNDNNLLVHLNPGQQPSYTLGLVPGYPLFGRWVRPIVAFADVNHDGVIEPNEVSVGDSLVFQGQPNPKYQLNLTTDVHLLGGRLGVYATFAYQSGLTQDNGSALYSSSLATYGNNHNAPLSYQAAWVAATDLGANNTDYGFIQTVKTFRFSDLSINYELPHHVASWFKVPRATVAIQGSNLGLHTNYQGKDPDVNAFSTVSSVDETADLGQIPEPRTWWLKFTLGN